MSLTAEDIQNIARAMQPAPPAPPAGAITASGLVKYQTIIIFCIMSAVGVGGWLVANSVSAATKMTNIERDLAELKSTRESISQVKADQARTSGEVRELQIAVNSINQSIKDMTVKFEAMSGDMRAVSQQVSAISQSVRTRQ